MSQWGGRRRDAYSGRLWRCRSFQTAAHCHPPPLYANGELLWLIVWLKYFKNLSYIILDIFHMLQISFPGLELIPPVTFKLCSGKGPVFISAQHITCKSYIGILILFCVFSGLGKTLYFSSLLIHKCENAGCWLEIWIAMTAMFYELQFRNFNMVTQPRSFNMLRSSRKYDVSDMTWIVQHKIFFFFSVDCIHFFNTMKTNKTGTNIDFQFAISLQNIHLNTQIILKKLTWKIVTWIL